MNYETLLFYILILVAISFEQIIKKMSQKRDGKHRSKNNTESFNTGEIRSRIEKLKQKRVFENKVIEPIIDHFTPVSLEKQMPENVVLETLTSFSTSEIPTKKVQNNKLRQWMIGKIILDRIDTRYTKI